MPIESTCQGCGRLLRVADEHAGKLARCPNCQTIYTVASPAAPVFRPASPFAETTPYPAPQAPAFVAPRPEPKFGDNPFADRPPASGVNPYAPPASGGAYNWPTARSRYREQHRGGAILAMSLVGILICQFVAIPAFIMALTDLGKMNQGTMDPSGRGLTIAGLVISSLSLLLFVLAIVVQIIAAAAK
jgi:hypothetical protein